ncbi:MAG: ADP-ribosyltransferase, partial [Actinomycetota bacterium]|nr:ADP-ribosyltransferase [Actinomycetota bacterium]
WSDNPAKAIGHLVPDILLAIATLGAGTAASATEKGATGAVKGAEALDDLAGAAAKLDDVADVAGATTKLDNVADLSKQLSTDESYATGWYTGSGYDEINSFERGTSPTLGGPHSTTELAKISDNLSAALGKQPAYEGVTYRGTSLPQQVLDDIDKTGKLSDPAFTSSSKSQTVAESFAQGQVNGNAVIEITGKSGKDVSGLSTMGPGEAEVLFDKGTTFDVVSKTWDSSLGMWRIVVKE